MIRFLCSTLTLAALLPRFFTWSRRQIEGQIDKMQQKVHFTPGAESPVPPSVLLAGLGLLVFHFLIGGAVLRLQGWQALLSLLAGLVGGVGWYLGQQAEENKS
jgi:hypothetical protein